MRTRRSPHNQDRLFTALFKPQAAPESRQPCRKCGLTVHRRLDGQCRMADVIRYNERRKSAQ